MNYLEAYAAGGDAYERGEPAQPPVTIPHQRRDAWLKGWAEQKAFMERQAAGGKQVFDPARLHRLTEVYQGYVDRGELPGAVLLVARDDQIAYLQAIGYQDREKTIPVSPDSIFRIASMTKPIVAAAAMMLVEEGRLDLAAPVAKYLPQIGEMQVGVVQTDPGTGKPALKLEPQRTVMRVQDLMRHTSGFIYGSFGDRLVHQAYRAAGLYAPNDTLTDTITKLSKLPLANQPGEVWEYGLSYDVLGRIVEVVSGMELDPLWCTIALLRRLTAGSSINGFEPRPAYRNSSSD